MELTFHQMNLYFLCYQVKTSEYSKPWEENIGEQQITSDNLSKARKQLERDVLRFAELLPDINFAEQLHFKFLVAFPFVDQQEERQDILTGPDFEKAATLKQKLNLHKTGQHSVGKIFTSIMGRYVGLHSVIPMKNKVEAFIEEGNILNNSIAQIDKAFGYSHIEEGETDSSGINSNDSSKLRDKLLNTDVSSKISDAITNKKYRERKFKEHFINCPVNSKGELDIYQTKAEENYPFKRESKCPIVIGEQQIRILIQHFDEKLEHEGSGKILEKINGDKVEIFDLKEDSQIKQNKPVIIRTFLNSNKPLTKYFDCQQCKIKCTLIEKGLPKSQKGKIILKDEDDVKMALVYGDYYHRGFQKAYSQLRSWCTFDDMEGKVSNHFHFFI